MVRAGGPKLSIYILTCILAILIELSELSRIAFSDFRGAGIEKSMGRGAHDGVRWQVAWRAVEAAAIDAAGAPAIESDSDSWMPMASTQPDLTLMRAVGRISTEYPIPSAVRMSAYM